MKTSFEHSKFWKRITPGGKKRMGYLSPTAGGTIGMGSLNRDTVSFEYVGENGDWDVAKGLGIEVV